jgi:hypothetical protein
MRSKSRAICFFFWAPFNKEKGENTFVDSYNIGSDSTFQFFIIKICFFSRRRLPMLVKRQENDDQHVCIIINSDCCVCVRINRWLLSRGVMREREKEKFEDGTVSAKGSRCPTA